MILHLILAIGLILNSGVAFAQDDTFWMMEAVIPPKFQLRYDLGLLANQKIKVTSSEHTGKVIKPIHPFYTALSKYHGRFFYPHGTFPSGSPLAGPLHDLEAGVVFRRVVAGNNQFGVGTVTGSASDRLFARDTLINETMAFYSWGFSEKQFFSAFVSYSNNRILLNQVPMPGFALRADLGESLGVLLGYPYAKAWIKPSSSTRLLAQSDWSNLRLLGRASFFLTGGIEFFAQAHRGVESYRRADRGLKSERLFYTEHEAVAGLNLNFFDTLEIEGAAGLGYQRELAEAERYADRKANRHWIEDGLVMRLGTKFSF